jgi:HAD superfamily hydrolase (TIGR01509 family)
MLYYQWVMNMSIKGILFDMDGVLVDSEPVILKAATLALNECGINPVPQDFAPFIGAGEDRFIGGVAEKYGLKYDPSIKKRVYEIYLEIVADEIGTFEGVAEILAQLTADGYSIGLASSADTIKINANLNAVGIDKSIFDSVVSGEDIVNKKPAPDVFLKGAELMGISPDECIVVEDAVNGVLAAVAAGMKCVGVCTSFEGSALMKAGAFSTIDTITNLMSVMRGI